MIVFGVLEWVPFSSIFTDGIEMLQNSTIAVVGLGYVGLPTAVALYENGFTVHGIDISEKTVAKISEGCSPLRNEMEKLSIPKKSERWSVSSGFEKIRVSDFVLITVPTPTNHDNSPDYSFVESAFLSVLSNIEERSGTIIILESTVSPGTTNRISSRIVEGLSIAEGDDFFLAYSPERVSPGEEGKTVRDVKRLVGCNDPDISAKISEMYSSITSGGCHIVESIKIAEAAKLIENVQRDVEIALINEFAIVLGRMGLDVEKVLDAAATKWSFSRFSPGIGVGGHCIPVDPYYYVEASAEIGYPTQIVPIARKVNDSMPTLSAKWIMDSINWKEDSRVLVLGYSYKPMLGDCRKTPVLNLSKKLHDFGLEVLVWDPYVDEDEYPEWVMEVADPYNCDNLDAIILATAHPECINLDWDRLLENCTDGVVFDGRRVLDPELMERNGWSYSGVGFPK